MNGFQTKRCTDVYMNRPAADHVPQYSEKRGIVVAHFQQRPFPVSGTIQLNNM